MVQAGGLICTETEVQSFDLRTHIVACDSLAGQTFQACPHRGCQAVLYCGKQFEDHVQKCEGSPVPETQKPGRDGHGICRGLWTDGP